MSAASYFRKKAVDWLTGVSTYAPPALYVSLLSADPGVTGSHTSEISTSGSGYARQPLAGKMGAADSVTGLSVNIIAINFGPAQVQWNVHYFGIEDALTAGNMLMPGIPQLPKIISVGASFQLVPGQLRLRLV